MTGLQHSPHTLEKVRISVFMLLTLKSFETVFLGFFFFKTVSGHSHFVQKDLLLRKFPSIYVEKKQLKTLYCLNRPPTLLFLATMTRGVSRVGLARHNGL